MGIMDSRKFRWMSVVILGWMLAHWPAGATGQEGSAPVPPITDPPPRAVAPSSDAHQELLDRLRKMEQRLDQVTKQNEELSREVRELRAVNRDQSQESPESRDATRSDVPRGGGTAGGSQPSQGGGSKSSGGDPTTTGRAQEVGNPHLGKLSLKSHYDFDDDGFLWSTKDDEYTFAIRGMTQLDTRIYQQTNQNPVSGGLYNPRSRFYFEGHFTKPIQYEFSFQNFYDTVQLLDAYVNFNYDPRLQLRIGRYKMPFTYEFYRIHIWHLLSPERSLFASNFEGNRRFGLMGWGVLFDNRLEYAVGTFDTQRNSFQPFNNRQDVMAFLNFKPFYNRREGFLLRDLQVGGSVDAGHEDQPLNPAVLRTNLGSPSGAGAQLELGRDHGRRAVPGVQPGGARAGGTGAVGVAHGVLSRRADAPGGVAEWLRELRHGGRWIVDAYPDQWLVRAGRLPHHGRDTPRPHPGRAAPPLRFAARPFRPRGLRADRPL